MTSVMLATYPDVFAGGAIIAGLPYGSATNVQQAFETMRQCPPRPARAWGDLVRKASPHKGPWPRVSVWHGGADGTVIPSTQVKSSSNGPTCTACRSSRPSSRGLTAIPVRSGSMVNGAGSSSSYTIPRMAHGTPLATGAADNQCGAAGPFLLEVGISSSYHIAKFFGVASAGRSAEHSRRPVPTAVLHMPDETDRATASAEPLDGEVLNTNLRAGYGKQPHLDIGAVITKALRTARLLKS